MAKVEGEMDLRLVAEARTMALEQRAKLDTEMAARLCRSEMSYTILQRGSARNAACPVGSMIWQSESATRRNRGSAPL